MKQIRICAECGLGFEATNGMQKFCSRRHFRKCEICGSEFEVTRYHLTASDAKTTCSKKCSCELRKRTNIAKYGGVAPISSDSVKAKMKATTLNRYGVEHAAQSSEIKEKIKDKNREKYGVDYFTQTDAYKDRMKNLWADSSYKSETRAAIERTCQERYGGRSSFSSKEIQDKCRDTYQSRTGYREPLSNPKVHEKSRRTNIDRYGVEYPLQNAEIKSSWEQTNIERYGYRNPMKNSEVLNKTRETCLERYGSTCFLQSDLGRKLTGDAMKSTFGVDWYSQSSEWKANRMLDPSKIDSLIKFEADPEKFIDSNFNDVPTLKELAESVGVHDATVGQFIIKHNLADKIRYVYSIMESEVLNCLRDIDPDISIETNTHRIITPYELDIYLPDYKIGIECNPTSTHNSSINTFNIDEYPTKYDYHKMKTELCEAKGVFLFHIFGSEWTYSRPVIESMLRNLLSKPIRRIYARKCKVRELDSSTCRKFLDENHRQGSVNSAVRLGLFLDAELVSVMTFGKMRSSIGTDHTDLSDCWELVRFCSLINTSVVGGASKLFRYFVNNFHPSRVRSFSDRAHTRGNLYSILGFREVRKSDPGYVWVDSRTDISYHRYSAQKQNIKEFLHDDSIDLSKTEKQIMEEHGFLQVFDSGTITWEWAINLK